PVASRVCLCRRDAGGPGRGRWIARGRQAATRPASRRGLDARHPGGADDDSRRHGRLRRGTEVLADPIRARRLSAGGTLLRAALLFFALGPGGVLLAQGGPAAWTVDTGRSRLTVNVLPAGLFASALHPHHFQPEDWSGGIGWDPSQPERVRVAVGIAAASLRDHQSKLSARDIAKVEGQTRGAEILDIARFPRILFEAGRLEAAQLPSGDGEFRCTLEGTLALHGQTRPLKLAVRGRVAAQRLEAEATG